MFTKYAFTLLLLCVLNTQCANILGVFNIPSVSHQVVFQPIWKELSLRGHQVTVITPNPLNDPTLTNLTEIDVGGVLYRIIEGTKRSGLARAIDHWAFTRKTNELNVKFTTEIFANEQVQALLANDTKTFDLVMIEPFYYSPAILAAKYNCPLIGVESLNVHTPVHELIGSPIHPLLYPDFATAYGREKTFFQKVDVVLFYFWQKYAHRKNMELIREEIRKHIDENLPDVDEVMKNMSLLFLNTNPILHGSRPYGPNVIEMGGMMHLTPEKPLPSVKPHLYTPQPHTTPLSAGTERILGQLIQWRIILQLWHQHKEHKLRESQEDNTHRRHLRTTLRRTMEIRGRRT